MTRINIVDRDVCWGDKRPVLSIGGDIRKDCIESSGFVGDKCGEIDATCGRESLELVHRVALVLESLNVAPSLTQTLASIVICLLSCIQGVRSSSKGNSCSLESGKA